MRSNREGQEWLPHSESLLRSLMWQDTRLDLIRDVLAHPKHAPSLTELCFINTYIDAVEIRFQLSMLVEYDILKHITYDSDVTSEDIPYTFYTLTDDGWAAIRYFNDEFTPQTYERLSEMYRQVINDAPPHVQEAEEAPRPRGPSDT